MDCRISAPPELDESYIIVLKLTQSLLIFGANLYIINDNMPHDSETRNSTSETSTTVDYLGTSHSGWGRSILLALLSLDIDGRKIFRDCGLDPEIQGQSLVRNPVSRMQYVWQMAESSVNNKSQLAIQIVKYMNASSFHALGFGLYASGTIASLFARMCRYSEVISSAVKMTTDVTDEEFHFTIHDLRPVKSHLTTVVSFLYLMRICRQLGGPELSAHSIEVPWTNNDYVDAMQSEMDVPIIYKCKHHRLNFDIANAHQPLPSGQSQLANFQDRLCRDYLHSLEEHRHLPSRVRLKILQGLNNNQLDIQSVASSLHMSHRTLQRRLREENTSYRDILREVRIELVTEYAQNPELNAVQISYLLGFSGGAQFSSQFKTWFGVTLTEYRDHPIKHQPL